MSTNTRKPSCVRRHHASGQWTAGAAPPQSFAGALFEWKTVCACVCTGPEPGVARFTAWVKPTVAGGSGDKVSTATTSSDDDLVQLAAMAGGGNAGEGSDDAESDWGGTASDAGSSNNGSRVSVVDVQTA